MLKVLIPAVAALGLVAFAARTQTVDAPAQTSATDVVAMAWHVSHEGPMVKIAYGVANSDQLALMITCEPGDTAAVVYGDVQPAGARLTHASMTARTVDPVSDGSLSDGSISDGAMSETRLGLADAGLRRLADAGVMRVTGDAGDFDLRATSPERRDIADALAYCATGRA